MASVTLVAGGAFLVARGLAIAQRRLLWRVRRKLIISYIFVGFVPAILIVAFFLLGGLLLFSNFSSYLLQTRLQSLSGRAAAVASTTAVEIQRAGGRGVSSVAARRQGAIAGQFPGASIAVVPMDRPCDPADTSAGASPEPRATVVAGPWGHVEPPAEVPSWSAAAASRACWLTRTWTAAIPVRSAPLAVDGQEAGRDVGLVARAIAIPDSPTPGYAVVVDLLVNEGVRDELRNETGVELTAVRTMTASAPLLRARRPVEEMPSTSMAAVPGVSASFPEIVDWATGETRSGTVVASMQLSIARDLQPDVVGARGPSDRASCSC